MSAANLLSNDFLVAVLMSFAIAIMAFPIVFLVMVVVIKSVRNQRSRK